LNRGPVESVIREKIVFLTANPGAGHWRKNLTDEAVKFFTVYSYLNRLPAGNYALQLSPFFTAVAT